MRIETINMLCCPFDREDLELTTIVKDVDGKVIEGFLLCSHCRRLYPIVRGVPIMSPDEYREFNLEKPLLDRWAKYLEGKRINHGPSSTEDRSVLTD